jgi:tetratricopeptide (TPR) repeat protein
MPGNQIEKMAMDYFNRGSEAVRSGNFDDAIEMFMTAVKLVPDNLIFRQSLREAEKKLYKDNGAGMAGLKMKPAEARLQIAKSRAKWPDVMEAAEDALRYNPWDTAMLYELGNAAAELGLTGVAIWALATADLDDKHAAGWRLLARLYESVGDFDLAQAAAGRAEHAEWLDSMFTSTDGEAPAIIREIADLEKKVRKCPGDVDLIVRLGDVYVEVGEPARATTAFQSALRIDPESKSVRAKLLEAQCATMLQHLERIEHFLAKLDPCRAGYVPRPDRLEQEVSRRREELLHREIDLFRLKFEINPSNDACYQLGRRLLAAGKLSESILLFLQALGQGDHRWETLYLLGIAYWRNRESALALDWLHEAKKADMNGDGIAKIRELERRIAEAIGVDPR